MGELFAYRDKNAKVGIRKHVVVLSLSSFCNTATNLICHAVRGTVPLTHSHGRNEIGVFKERLDRSLLGAAINPNVHAVLVVGYEEKTTNEFVQSARKHCDKSIESVTVLEEGGTWNAVRSGAEKALDLVLSASEVRRVPVGLRDLVVAVKCGGSDATSGIASNAAVGCAVDRIIEEGGTAIFSETTEILGTEHILARRAVNKNVAEKIYQAVERNERLAMDAGIDLLGVNPVPDNIRGGISTIEEKSLGAILKAGNAEIQDVLGYGESPSKPGLYFMDSPSDATGVMTGLSAAGAQIILFSTGTGNPAGNPISPVLKITSNPRTASRIKDHIDVDISDVLTGTTTVQEAGDSILEAVMKVINGRLTKAEILGHMEFAPIPVGL